ncbi:hypothetical protein LCR01_07900 [Companilactobacillus crustorum]|uniref:Uncharacterized protein n=3 Tax=Companilactobacillus TaxID=2767879 RepID=A0A837RJB3_9LACO|nr:hypothetical protein [Companilactobacillus crustorum]HCD06941.1 hypothetical protein [Lactobacillus sp.]APU70867.1 hypothetical protein BI355_0515 [Companilactobacillus crustorum]KRK42938.1 hypothetical protein FD26_GL000282 [Companilactobacillus crustorum JCM 15951]KRO20595.1 hypothetical protein IV63_GL000408 [Companilactobacillus crustorum]WDT64919.1 hypothetical protein NV391_08065 [Companilactobacillus crustorum]
MKKKILIGLILAAGSAGTYFAISSLTKLLKNKAVQQDRKKLESYVDEYLHGNEKLMEFVGTLSDDQVKELIEILDALKKEQNQLKLKAPVFPKYLEKKVTNLIS